MKYPIEVLEVTLQTVENNEAVYLKEAASDHLSGHKADYAADCAAQTRQALAILRAAAGGPIPPASEETHTTTP